MLTQKDVLVCNFDVQPDSFMKASAMFRYYQQAARENTDALGLTFEKMLEYGKVFVLTRMKHRVYSHIKGYDNLSVKTSSREIKGALFVRDFAVYNGEKLVAEATTNWALIDINTRRLVRPSVYEEFFGEKTALCSFEAGRKCDFIQDTDSFEYLYKVTYSDTDENRHLNNTRYIDICLDALGGVSDEEVIVEVIIDFMTEAKMGEELLVKYKRNDDIAIFTAENITTGKISFKAEIKFAKK